jgi:streptogramin lyase
MSVFGQYASRVRISVAKNVRLMKPLASVILMLVVAGCSQAPEALTPPQMVAATKNAAGSTAYKVYTAGKTPGFLGSAFALDVAADGQGNVWFTDPNTPAIGRISASGKLTEYQSGLPSGAKPFAIVPGANDTMWFSDSRGLALGSVSSTGAIQEFSGSSSSNMAAQEIAVDRLGRPWIVGQGATTSALAYLSNGHLVMVALPKGLAADGSLAVDATGNFWLLTKNTKDTVTILERSKKAWVQIPTGLGSIRNPCCPNRAPKPIVVGPDGNPWFTTLYYGSQRYAGKMLIGTVRGQRVHLFAAMSNPGLPSYPSGIASDGRALAFTGGDPFQSNGALWCINHDGSQTVSSVPYNPVALTIDSNGSAWFSAYFSGGISQIVKVVAPLNPRCKQSP